MSAGVSRGNASSRLGRWWQDWRFHLSALAIAVPIACFPAFYDIAMRGSGKGGLGARAPSVVQVGPFAIRIAEFNAAAPLAQGVAGDRKQFNIALCDGCDQHIRAVYLRIGKPRSVRAAGALFSGGPARMEADLQIPPSASVGDGLWLTIEEWNGAVHKGQIAIDAVSPATADWMRRKESKT